MNFSLACTLTKSGNKKHCSKCNDKGIPNYSGKDTFAFFTAEQVTQLVGGESML